MTNNNTVYLADSENHRVLVWSHNSPTPTRILRGNLSSPAGLFVTIDGDIYVDNGAKNGRIDKWTANDDNSVPVMHVNSSCFGLFVDIHDHLYCSLFDNHTIVKRKLTDPSMIGTQVAGNGTAGFAPTMLDSPVGIFVDTDLNLYVADMGNDRIQLFRSGEHYGITVAGRGSVNFTISLSMPSDVVLDGNKNLFIVDMDNDRILAQGPSGFRCIVGCTGSRGSSSNQLNWPRSLRFDSYGNMFVVDYSNHRLQKFLLSSNSCGE